MAQIAYMIYSGSIQITLSSGDPVLISKSEPIFEEVKAALCNKESEEKILAIINRTKIQLELCKNAGIEFKGEQVFFEEEYIGEKFSKCFFDAIDSGKEVLNYIRFINKLFKLKGLKKEMFIQSCLDLLADNSKCISESGNIEVCVPLNNDRTDLFTAQYAHTSSEITNSCGESYSNSFEGTVGLVSYLNTGTLPYCPSGLFAKCELDPRVISGFNKSGPMFKSSSYSVVAEFSTDHDNSKELAEIFHVVIQMFANSPSYFYSEYSSLSIANHTLEGIVAQQSCYKVQIYNKKLDTLVTDRIVNEDKISPIIEDATQIVEQRYDADGLFD